MGAITVARRGSIAASGSSGKAPNLIGNLFAWFDASQITGKSDGDAITTWTNLQGTSARDARQAAAGKRPLYKTGIVNGKPVVRFDGSDDSLGTGASLTLAQPLSVFVVAQLRGSRVANDTIFDGGGTNSSRLFWFSSTQVSMYAGGSIAPRQTVAMSGAFHLLECVFNGASSSIRADGSAATTGSSGTGTPNGLTLGATGSGAEVSAVDIAEYALFTGTLSTADRQSLEKYFGAKYGLSVGTNA